MKVQVQCLSHFEGLELPAYATLDAAGMDLRCAFAEPVILKPLQRMAVPTGLCIALPRGFEGQVRPRSGLSLRHGLTVINSPGTIDADYRGEIKVPLVNLGEADIVIDRGMRIAQLVIAPIQQIRWQVTDTLPDSSRGTGGFGHTGAG